MKKICDFLRSNDRYALLSHHRPDGDAIGSCAALCRALRKIGKEACFYPNPDLSQRYADLVEDLMMPEDYVPDHYLSCDIASDGILPTGFDIRENVISYAIDHHRMHTLTANGHLVDPDAASCGEIVYEILREMDIPMDPDIAKAIYIAVSTDTGCFRFGNTTAHTHMVAAECFKYPFGAEKVNREIFDTKSRVRFEVERYMFENMRFYDNNRIALATLPRERMLAMGAADDDLDNLSSLLRQIEGVIAAITLTENAEGDTKISVRTLDPLDAGKVCLLFGGGGHKQAAGGTLKGKPDQNVQTVLEAVEKCLQAL